MNDNVKVLERAIVDGCKMLLEFRNAAVIQLPTDIPGVVVRIGPSVAPLPLARVPETESEFRQALGALVSQAEYKGFFLQIDLVTPPPPATCGVLMVPSVRVGRLPTPT